MIAATTGALFASLFFGFKVIIDFDIAGYGIGVASNYGGGVMPKSIRSFLTNSIPSGLYAGSSHGISRNVWRMEDNRSKGMEISC